MWKRLSRLWKKGDLEAGVGPDSATELLRRPEHDADPMPAPEVRDPIRDALERFDEEHKSVGAAAVVAGIRELVHAAPTDARVLRRAAALLRELGDENLAEGFEQAARSSSGEPLAELGHAFLTMDDAELALALGDGAMQRARELEAATGRRRLSDEGDGGLAAGRLVGALALSRLGEHARVIERLEPALDDGVAVRVRWALAALALGDLARADLVLQDLGEAEAWIAGVRARAAAFPPDAEANDPQRQLFTLYGAALLDDAGEGERLEETRLLRWMEALATLVREHLPAGTRPAWVSPRGEVLARWLGSYFPEEGAMPLSARLPKQPVLVVLADDDDLAALVQARAYADGPLPIFQALKDPREIGSPVADVIGVFRADVQLPFEGLDAERAADRLPPRMLASRLSDTAQETRFEPAELAPFLGWARARAAHLTLCDPPAGGARLVLDVARGV